MNVFLKIIYSAAMITILIFANEKIITVRVESEIEILRVILGSAPNFLSVFFISLIIGVVSKKKIEYPILYTIGLVLYEFVQIYIPDRTFDFFDIVASVLGLLFYLILLKLLLSWIKVRSVSLE